MRYVSLDFTSPGYAVSEEGFEQIRALLQSYRICQHCEATPMEGNPIVGKNICLVCMQNKHSDLTYDGLYQADSHGRMQYAFLDAEGYIHLSTANLSDQPVRDLRLTLEHWHFTLPVEYDYQDQTLQFDNADWNLYGDPRTSSVIVAEKPYNRKLKFVFLLYREGGYKELTKRDKAGKSLLAGTKETLKRANSESSSIEEEDIYSVVAQMENAIYNVEKAFVENKAPGL